MQTSSKGKTINKCIKLILALFLLLALGQSQYCNQTLNGTTTCYPCYYRCKDCSGISEFNCISCTKEYLLINNTCLSCGNNCYSCKSIIETSYITVQNIQFQCETCIQGYYLYQSTGECIKCPIGAQTCTLSAIQSCLDGFYLLNGVCLKCQSNCISCIDSSTCSICSDGNYLNSTTSTCQPCLIPNCLPCDSSSNCNSCYDGFSGANCTQVCPSNCAICYSGSCYVCMSNFYLLNSICQPGKILCRSSSQYRQCDECFDDMSSLSTLSNCIPFNTVHDENRLIYLTAINNFDSFSSVSNQLTDSKQIVYCNDPFSIYMVKSSNGILSFTVPIQPSYKVYLSTLVFVDSPQFSVSVTINGQVLNNSLNFTAGTTKALCGDKNYSVFSTGFSFQLSNTFNSSNQNLSITFQFNPVNSINSSILQIGVPELYLQLYRCRVSNCLACQSAYTCQSCIYPFKLQNNECLKVCDQGYYLTEVAAGISCTLECLKGFYPVREDYTCKECQFPCTQCEDANTCLKCYHPNTTLLNNTTSSSNQTYFLFNSQCVSQCPLKYFADYESYNCQECIFPCETCLTFIQCNTCQMGYLNTNTSKCVTQCPKGQYSDFLKFMCLPCQSPCISCQYTAEACSECVLPYYLFQKNSSCLLTCPSGYASLQSPINYCKECKFPCKSCDNSQTNCTSCFKGYLYDNKCYSQCPSTLYKSTSSDLNNICIQCENNCLECSDKQTCVNCQVNYKFNTLDKSCVDICPKGTYQQIYTNISTTTINKSCLQCIPPCYECLNSTYCLSCTGLLFLNHLGECLMQCPEGTYVFYNSSIQQRECLLCLDNCVDCVSVINCNECKDGWLLWQGICYTACPDGTFANLNGFKYCQECQYPCETCINEYECLTCVGGFLYQQDNFKCVQFCTSGYFQLQNNTSLNNTLRYCLKCNPQCETCIYNQSNCLTCAFGYFYNQQLQLCSQQCPDGTYYSIMERTCHICQYPCKTCESYGSCLSCFGKDQLTDNSTNISNLTVLDVQYIFLMHNCLNQCPSGYFETIINNASTCQQCQFPCDKCFSSADNCTKCQLPTLTFITINPTNSSILLQCLTSCPSGYYPQSYQCQPCQQPCKQCSSMSYCNECIQGWYLREGECFQVCPFHLYSTVQNNINVCLTCSSQCKECISKEDNCTSCTSNKYLTDGNTCVMKCPGGFYASPKLMQCLPCQTPCLQCYSKSYCITCQTGYLMQVNKCVSICDSTFYLPQPNSTYCTPCIFPCQKCISKQKCSSCVSGYYYLNSNNSCTQRCPSRMYGYKLEFISSSSSLFKGVCLDCSQLCMQCSSYSVCMSCQSERMYLEEGRCQTNCSEGYFYSYNSTAPYEHNCIKCRQNCLSCSAYDNCFRCISSYLHNNQCVKQCPNLYYGSSSLVCQKCRSPCYQCFNEYQCASCVQGYYLYNNICVKHCPQELWTDMELRRCVVQCESGKFMNVENRTCLRKCDMFYSSDAKCVSRCQDDTEEYYFINSTLGCEACLVNDNSYCSSIATQLKYILGYIVVDGRLVIIVKFATQMQLNSQYLSITTYSSPNHSIESYLAFSLQKKLITERELDMFFLKQPSTLSYKLSSSQQTILTSSINHHPQSVGITSQIPSSSSLTPLPQNLPQLVILTKNSLWLQFNSLPSQLTSFTGYLNYQINNYLQLLSKTSFQLSPSVQSQNLPLQQVQQQTIEVNSFSAMRKMPSQFTKFMKIIANILSYTVLILCMVNLIFDNLKSQFHLIDATQNLYLIFWIGNNIQLGITEFLNGFNISALMFNFSSTYGSDNFIHSISELSKQILWNCTPQQLIYGNACQFTQHYILLLPFIGVFLLVIGIGKFFIYLKPFIESNLKIHHKIIYNHINNFYWLFITPIFFISTSEFILLKKASEFSVLNLILIIFASLLTLVLMYQVLKNIFNCSYEEKTFFWGLKCHKIQNQQANIHFFLLMVRKSILLVAVALSTAYHTQELVYFFLLVFVSIIILSNILVNSPFKKRSYQYILVGCQICLVAFYLAFQIYIVSVKNFDQVTFVVYNCILFIIALTIVILHLVISLIETWKHLKRKYMQYNILEEENNQDIKSSSCDSSVKDDKHRKQGHSQHSIKPEKDFTLLPASLEKIKGSKQNLQTRGNLGKGESSQIDSYTKGEKVNNQQDSNYESSSGFNLHSQQHSQEFDQPAKYLIKLEKNLNDKENDQN